MSAVKRIADHIGSKDDKPFKATLFESGRLLLGLNVLQPGQVQKVHDHADQDKFYLVQSGEGIFTVGSFTGPVGVGHVVWAEAGMPHGVRNEGDEPLVLVVGIAPGPTRS